LRYAALAVVLLAGSHQRKLLQVDAESVAKIQINLNRIVISIPSQPLLERRPTGVRLAGIKALTLDKYQQCNLIDCRTYCWRTNGQLP
jgi:hypothetical protein